MDDDSLSVIGTLLALSIFLFGTFYACYYLGRYLERREYTAAFTHQVEAAYYEGLRDGKGIAR